MLFYLNTIMEFCIEDAEEILGDIEYIENETTNFAKLILEETSLVSPAKESDDSKEDNYFKGFSIGTTSTAASNSDSILTPFIDKSDRRNTDEKEDHSDAQIQEKRDDDNQIVETKNKLVKSPIPRNKRFSLQELKQFMDVAPKIAQIRQGIKHMKSKEVIIYKILLDMVGSYLRNFRTFNSRTYQEKYIPAVLEFYNRVEAEELAVVMKTISESL